MAEGQKVKRSKNKLTMNYIFGPEGYAEVIAEYLNQQPGRHPITAEDVTEEMKYFSIYRGLIQSGDGDVVGLGDCYVSKVEDTVYGENLLIDPKYQGLVYGGSFMLTIFDKIKQIYFEQAGGSMAKMVSTLQSGNLRAGALYERIGYFAKDKEGNCIQNFFSFVYAYPLANKFFKKHGIELVNCWKYYRPIYDEMLQKMKIKTYPYVFGTKDDHIRIILDAISEYPMLVDDSQILAACWVEEQQAYVGLQKNVTWLLKNNTDRPLKLAIHAESKGGLKFRREEEITLKPQEGRMLTSPINVVMCENPEDNIILTNIQLEDENISLKTGYFLKEICDCNFERDMSRPFRIGENYTRSLKISNKFTQPLKIKGKCNTINGVILKSADNFDLEISPGQHGELVLEFMTQKKGVGLIQVELFMELIPPGTDQPIEVKKTVDIDINVLDFDQVLAWRTENGNLLLMENENYVIIMPLKERNGSFYIYDKLLKEEILQFPEEELGPPFIPEFVHNTTPLFWVRENRIKKDDGQLILSTKLEHRFHQGIFIIRELKMTSSNTFTVDYTLENGSQEEFTTGLLRKVRDIWRKGVSVLPLKKGLVRQKANGIDYPGTSYQVNFAEGWMALEDGGRVLGVIWNNEQSRISYRKTYCLPQIDLGSHNLKPGDSKKLPTIYFYYGSGDARTIRNLYDKVGYTSDLTLPERDMVDLNLNHKQLVITQRESTFELKVDRAIDFLESKWMKGELKVSGPENWELKIDNNLLKIKVPEDIERGLYTIKVSYVTDHFEKEWSFVIQIAGILSGSVKIERSENENGVLYNLDNGEICYQMAPDYNQRIISLQKGSQEYLCSNFPEARAYHKESPWYGGIGCNLALGKLLTDKVYNAVQISEGMEWHGIGYKSKVTGWDGVTVNVEYLTIPGTPMMVIHSTILNETKRRIYTSMAFDFNLTNLQKAEQVSGYIVEKDKLIRLKFYPEQEKLDRKFANKWTAIEVQNGDHLVVVHPGQDHEFLIQNWGAYGVHLKVKQNLYLGISQKNIVTFYVMFEQNINKALEYLNLKPLVLKERE